MAVYNDGIVQKLRGCRGKSKLAFKNGEPSFIDFEFMGAAVSDDFFLARIPPDRALLTVTFHRHAAGNR